MYSCNQKSLEVEWYSMQLCLFTVCVFELYNDSYAMKRCWKFPLKTISYMYKIITIDYMFYWYTRGTLRCARPGCMSSRTSQFLNLCAEKNRGSSNERRVLRICSVSAWDVHTRIFDVYLLSKSSMTSRSLRQTLATDSTPYLEFSASLWSTGHTLL